MGNASGRRVHVAAISLTSTRSPDLLPADQQRPSTSNFKMADERTFIMIKPDGVQRGLVGEIIKRFEQKGFQLVAIKFMQADEELLKQHYAHGVAGSWRRQDWP